MTDSPLVPAPNQQDPYRHNPLGNFTKWVANGFTSPNTNPKANGYSSKGLGHDVANMLMGGGELSGGVKMLGEEAGSLLGASKGLLPEAESLGKHALDYSEEADGPIQTGGKYALRKGESALSSGARMLGRGVLREATTAFNTMGNPQTWANQVNGNLSSSQFKVI